MKQKKFFHLLTQEEIDEIIQAKHPVDYLKKNYQPPEWCKYPGALHPLTGCWALTDVSPSGCRTHISHEYCAQCECYTGDKQTYIDFESDDEN